MNTYFTMNNELHGWIISLYVIQKQSFKDFLQNKLFQKFRNIQRKTPALKSLFKKVADLKGSNLIKKTWTQVFPYEYWEIFKNSFFYRTPPVAASYYSLWHLLF